MAILTLSNGEFPPLGAQVTNSKNQNVGVVGESGNTYISGVHPSETMSVAWGKNTTCEITFPNQLQGMQNTLDNLLLPCKKKLNETRLNK
ncbi:TPA: FimD/PapC C-terminal domain-containing protein [Providencia alcalifaciens]